MLAFFQDAVSITVNTIRRNLALSAFISLVFQAGTAYADQSDSYNPTVPPDNTTLTHTPTDWVHGLRMVTPFIFLFLCYLDRLIENTRVQHRHDEENPPRELPPNQAP